LWIIAAAGADGVWFYIFLFIGVNANPIGDSEANRNAAHCWLARVIASDRAPTKMRLKAQVASRLNQLRDTNLRPRYR
jgi:hypothetical protein